MNNFYKKIFTFGTLMGCHQLPERSFFIKGYQFPVCARCTGVLIGYLAGLVLHTVIGTYLLACTLCCLIMFIDWYLQHLNIKVSTNFRRVITGVLGGYGVIGFYLIVFSFIVNSGEIHFLFV
ncbi:MAG: DUF2085 domain-containing protein [Clostridia bacterium]|nr:DUF2085 domain-containing protein [Clostridia bacterium]